MRTLALGYWSLYHIKLFPLHWLANKLLKHLRVGGIMSHLYLSSIKALKTRLRIVLCQEIYSKVSTNKHGNQRVMISTSFMAWMARKHEGILQKYQSTKKVHNHSLTSKTANKKKPKESLCNLSLEKTLEKKAYSELWGFFTLKK